MDTAGPDSGKPEQGAPFPGGAGAKWGCFGISLLIFLGGTALWIFRPAEWGIPGIACFAIMAIGLTGLKAMWGEIRGKSE